MSLLIVYTLLLLVSILLRQSSTQEINYCDKATCSECIQTTNCTWCQSPSNNRYCQHTKNVNKKWCSESKTVNPQHKQQIVQNKDLSKEENKVVQIKPQQIKLKLRKGQEFQIKFQYARAADYPVDLYYIMDLSHSMKPHKDKLGKLGEKLALAMAKITKNFKLGFGSFIDKVALPFTTTGPSKDNPPYSFKNHMSLTDNYRQFADEVSKAKISGNYDTPEGGFDGLMQAIVCKEEINWRLQSRHLIVFSTDAPSHIGGDGKLAGVVEPNDAKCHMTNGNYTHSLTYDYPSVSHINYVAQKNNINLIFAIVKNPQVVDIYNKLSTRIKNSVVGVLDEDSENVINLVRDNYNRIVDFVKISTNASGGVDVKITPNCDFPIENGCNNTHVNQKIDFIATIKPTKCTKGSNKHTFTIKPESVDEELLIELEVICDCDCDSESPTSALTNSTACSSNGDLKCGICECNAGRAGKKCECESTNFQNSAGTSACQTPKGICNGAGQCKCGKCQCSPRKNPEEVVSGEFCQCDNYSCNRYRDKLCSNHGTCECGVCNCDPGYTGEDCRCPVTSSNCLKPGQTQICNGHGDCVCGRCECRNEDVRFSGQYCDECPTCATQRCDELQNCVECQACQRGIFEPHECSTNCTEFQTEIVNGKIGPMDDQKICTIPIGSGCTFTFQYGYNSKNKLIVKAEKEKICPLIPPVFAYVSAVSGSILLAGLILLIVWKICTSVHDRREYAKFEKEKANMNWNRNDNPLYKEATTNFNNPSYAKNRFSFRNSK